MIDCVRRIQCVSTVNRKLNTVNCKLSTAYWIMPPLPPGCAI